MPLFEPTTPANSDINPHVTISGTDQYGMPNTFTWTFNPVDQAVRSVREILDRYLRTERNDALTRELFAHRFAIMNQANQRGFDGRYSYQDACHGQWGCFFRGVGAAYEYIRPTRADEPGFTVMATPDIRAAWFVGDMDAQRLPTSVLRTIGAFAVRTSSPAFLSLGPVQVAAIIGIIPSVVPSYRRFMPRGEWPHLEPPYVAHLPFHIVTGYQFAICPQCNRGTMSLASDEILVPGYAGDEIPVPGYRTTISHGTCGQYTVRDQDQRIALAIADAVAITEIARRQESYSFGTPARWW